MKTNRDKVLSRRKWLVALIVTLVLVIFGRLVDNKALSSSALVIGLGIDYQNGEFAVSAESVIVSGSSGEGGTSQSFVVYAASGKTISEALGSIGRKMGLIVSLSHCNVLVLTTSMLHLSHVDTIQPLVSKFALSEQAVITATSDDPEIILSKKVATFVATPFFLQTVLIQNAEQEGLNLLTVKDMAADSMSKSAAAICPYISVSELESDPVTASQPSEKTYVVSMDNAIAFSESKHVVLNKEQAFASSLLTRRSIKGSLASDKDGLRASFKISKKQIKRKFEGMTQDATLKFKVALNEIYGTFSPDDVSVTPTATEMLNIASDKLKKSFDDCYALSQSSGIDFLGLKNYAYQNVGYTLPDDCLGELKLNVKIEAEIGD